ncbi:MAG: glycosyltransferase [Lachnospiraceae bacterium]|nr:glycosyltransferase [Lachnospiraceae bacterium]
MTLNMPKVSICAPAYNNAPEVRRLLDSIYAQEYTDFEVNISDDSTNDEIERMVAAYRESRGNINYIRNREPYGHIFNWNAAIKMAHGEYIKIMFSDDWFTDEKSLGAYVELLDKAPGAMLAFSGSRQVELDNAMKYRDRCASPAFIGALRSDYRHLFCGNGIGAPSATIYRRGESLTMFDEKSNWASDMYLYFDLLIKSPEFAYTTRPLISIGEHKSQYTESFSEKDRRIYNDYRYMYEKYGLRESRECSEYFTRSFIVKYGRGMSEAGKLGIGRLTYLRAFVMELFDSVRCFAAARMGD